MRNLYDLIIIGGGPAGITAGIYSARKRLKSLLLSKDFLGQVGKTGEVENYLGFPSITGMDLMRKFEEHLRKFEIDPVRGRSPRGDRRVSGGDPASNGVEIQTGEEVTNVTKQKYTGCACVFSVKTESGKEFLGRAIIIATGRDPRPLEVPGEKEFIGKGVSYCSICDSPFFQDKAVAVVGGGNAGFEAALDLAKYAKRVYIFERSNKIIADEILQERVKKGKKIEVLLNKELKKIEGRGKVQAIIYQDLKTNKTYQQPIGGVFVQIGAVPATGFLKGLARPVKSRKAGISPKAKLFDGVEFNKWDEIKVDFKTGQTSTPGIFAAGDVNDGKWKQIIIAAGEGCRAALAAYDYLQKKNNDNAQN